MLKAAQKQVARPQRWDVPFSDEITDADVDGLLVRSPFAQMNQSAFPRQLSLRGILKNDCRVNCYQDGELILREGDYGHSVFMVLEGTAHVSLKSIPPAMLGRKESKKKSWMQSLSQLWTNARAPEVRRILPRHGDVGKLSSSANVFLQDVPRVLALDQKVSLTQGELFGELAALTRTPRSATIVAGSPCNLLEMRWQGFRDIIKRDSSLRKHVDQLYRQNSLRVHLRQTPILRNVSEEAINELVEATEFESFGNFDWNHQFNQLGHENASRRIQSEPLIATEGEYVDGLILIRNGFARVSQQYGDGHRTFAYVGKGEVFGLRELAHNWNRGEQRPYSLSLRAVGYVDILRIPTRDVEDLILPKLPDKLMPDPLPAAVEAPRAGPTRGDHAHAQTERRQSERPSQLSSDLTEFLVEHRFVNGTQAMVIDLNRCTRCDDCVRACAATHDNNPRFVRSGPQHDHWMVAGACMHCVDPVCMIGCPTGAISRHASSGNVTINDQTCIGCSTCANSCPYSNIRMVEIRDRRGNPLVDSQTGESIRQATKCDLCSEQMGGPACQRACPHDALARIDLTSPQQLYDLDQR